jgi:hypothetical protein
VGTTGSAPTALQSAAEAGTSRKPDNNAHIKYRPNRKKKQSM